MDASSWAAIAAWVAAVVAFVSTGVTLYVQWWRKPEVRWLCDGRATIEKVIDSDGNLGPNGVIDVRLVLVNCGDGDAYGVEVTRCNGGEFLAFTSFERGVLRAGESIEVSMGPTTSSWESCWVELRYRSRPTSRSPELRSSGRFYPAQELAGRDRMVPGYDPKKREDGRRAPGLAPEDRQD